MATISIAREVAEAVAFELTKVERSKQWLSDKSGIPYATLNRKLAGHVEFTFSELIRIADALGVSASTFVPAAFTRAVA